MIALAFGAGTLLVAGLGLLVLAGLAPAWVLIVALSLRVERELPRSRVQEGEKVHAAVTVSRRLPLVIRAELEDPLAGPEPVALSLREGRQELDLQTAFPRRGRVVLEPTRLSVADPLSLLRVTRRSGTAQEVLVLPALHPVSWSGGTLLRRELAAGERAGLEPPAALEVDGVRPYRPGTPATRIHWPSLARGAGLMERRLRADGDELPLVVLDPGSPAGEPELDAAVRAAASLAVSLARREGCRVMVGAGDRPVALGRDLTGWDDVHGALALVEGDYSRRAGTLRVGAGGPLILVCACWPALAGPQAAAATVVVPAALAPRHAGRAFVVAGCVGVRAAARGEAA